MQNLIEIIRFYNAPPSEILLTLLLSIFFLKRLVHGVSEEEHHIIVIHVKLFFRFIIYCVYLSYWLHFVVWCQNDDALSKFSVTN
jgi:hypothetical protein